MCRVERRRVRGAGEFMVEDRRCGDGGSTVESWIVGEEGLISPSVDDGGSVVGQTGRWCDGEVVGV